MRMTIGWAGCEEYCEQMLSPLQKGSSCWGERITSGEMLPRRSRVCKASECQPLLHANGLPEE